MKVLHVFFNWGQDTGGPFTVLSNMASRFVMKGIENHIIVVSRNSQRYSNEFIGEIGKEKVSVPLDVCKSYEEKIGFSLEFIRKFKGLASRDSIAMIHGMWRFPRWYAAYSCRKSGVPYIIYTHGMTTKWSIKQKKLAKIPIFYLIEKNNFNHAALILVNNDEEIEILRSLGVNADIRVFKSAISKEDFPNSMINSNKHKNTVEMRQLLYLSRIHKKKGLDVLLKAMTNLVSIYPEISLTIAGPVEDRNYYKEICNYCNRKGLSRYINFIGQVEGDKKRDCFLQSDIFILPSIDEGSPVAVLEAMGYGLPVVITPGCRMPEVEGKMGFVVDQDPEAIAKAISALINDAERAKEMGAFGRGYVLEQFSWDKRIKELSEIINEIRR
jgi:glycosyltransferase involved in cell wall biosynthesis